MLADCKRDQLLHVISKTIVPCFVVKQKGQAKKHKIKWTVVISQEGVWKEKPGTNSYLLCCGENFYIDGYWSFCIYYGEVNFYEA